MAAQDEQKRPLPNPQHPLEPEMTPQQWIERLQEEHEVLRQQLIAKQKENQQLKTEKDELEKDLKEKGEELERLRPSWPCTRHACQQAQQDLQGLKQDLQKMLKVPCRRPECVGALQRATSLELENARLKSSTHMCTRDDCQQAKQELHVFRLALQVGCRRPECAGAQQQNVNLQWQITELQSEKSQLQSAADRASETGKSLQKERAENDKLQCQVKQQQRDLSTAKETKDKLQEVTKERDEAKANLQRANAQIKQMERTPCNNLKCSNDHAKRMVSVLGSKLLDSSGSREMTVTEALQHMDTKLEKLLEDRSKPAGPSYAMAVQGDRSLEEEYKQLKRKLESLQRGACENDACTRQKNSLQRKVDDLTSQMYGPTCQRPECTKLRQELRQKQVAEIGHAGSIGKDMGKITGGDYGKLIQWFEDLTTSPDGLLGELENAMEPFQAKQLVSKVFMMAYNRSRMMVNEAIKIKLEALFALNKSAPKEEMEDTSRGYGRLLHASGVKANQAAHVAALTQQVCSDLQGPKSTYRSTFQQIFRKQPSIIGEVVELAWEMVTLPNPMVISKPDTVTEQTHEREFGYWDPLVTDAQLIYLRPVVYRSYQGDLACKAWVANSQTQLPLPPSAPTPDEKPKEKTGEGGGLLSYFGYGNKN